MALICLSNLKPSHHVFSGKLGQKCCDLLPCNLQGIVLKLLEEPTLTKRNIDLGEPHVFTLSEAIVHKECFGGRFPGTASAKFDTISSRAMDRESAVRNAINTATSKLLRYTDFTDESVLAFLLSPVLGAKSPLVTKKSAMTLQIKGHFS